MKKLAVALTVCSLVAGLGYAARGYAAPVGDPVEAALALSVARPTVAPGGRIDVDVLVSNVADLRTFQLQLEASGGERGDLSLAGITIDKTRSDFVFGTDMVIDAVDMVGLRAGALRFDGGVKVETPVYLATFHFRASADARGTFRINVLEGEESFLADSSNQKIAHGTSQSVEVRISGLKAPSRPRTTRATESQK